MAMVMMTLVVYMIVTIATHTPHPGQMENNKKKHKQSDGPARRELDGLHHLHAQSAKRFSTVGIIDI